MTRPHKILIVTNGNIGDFVLATSALKLIRENRKNDAITLITSVRVKSFVEKLNLADSVIYTDFSFAKNFFFQRKDQIIWFFKNYRKIKNERFDDCIFLDHSRFFAKAVPMMKIRNLIGPSTWWCGNKIPNPNIKSLTDVIELPENSDNVHMIERYQTIARAYTKSCNLAMPVLPQTPYGIKEKIRNLLGKNKKHSIILSLQGDNIKGNRRIYPLSNAVEAIKQLNDFFDAAFYFTGTKTNSEYAENVKKLIKNAQIHNLCGQTSLFELKSLLEESDILISVDTGTVHIGAEAKIPIVAIYGPNKPSNSMPVSSKAEILYTGESCSPCHYSRTVLAIPCPCGGAPACLSNITPEMVVEAAKKILGEKQ